MTDKYNPSFRNYTTSSSNSYTTTTVTQSGNRTVTTKTTVTRFSQAYQSSTSELSAFERRSPFRSSLPTSFTNSTTSSSSSTKNYPPTYKPFNTSSNNQLDAKPYQPQQAPRSAFGPNPTTSSTKNYPLTYKPFNTSSNNQLDAKPYQPQQAPRSAFGQTFHKYGNTVPTKVQALPTTLSNGKSETKLEKSSDPAKYKIEVTKTGKYYDDQKSKIPTYQTRKKRRGYLLLFNNIEFQGNRKRDGAEVDQENLEKLFRQMGFTVISHKNKRKNMMEWSIKDFMKKSDLKNVDMCFVIVMSHGTGTGGLTAIETIDGNLISTEYVIDQFNSDNCPSLKGKPKIFIFQCCRGDDIQTDSKVFQTPRKVDDVLVGYSTVPGYVSYRTGEGSWYIQLMCRIFGEHAHDTDVENLLKMVDKELSVRSGQFPDKGLVRQTSNYENRGFKRCFLHPI